jgi:hypothetical protein
MVSRDIIAPEIEELAFFKLPNIETKKLFVKCLKENVQGALVGMYNSR